ncbi:MAG: tRNA glutamyl-Q(34) synthetase GluQRS [Kangiellaceae bacterium]|nr:tRNA glutamyl-Q(34) synthetase GluQRS [Kangiellaceae bacterium]
MGRFAPTPSGPLHFGSLVAALASYLVAKQRNGKWLIRVEDIDPPREVPGAAKSIIETLEAFGFEWDGEITYQSKRNGLYQKALEELHYKGKIYLCHCSRKQVQLRNNGIYDGYCRTQNSALNQSKLFDLTQLNETAIRAKFAAGFELFHDHILGQCQFESEADKQDFILFRRDSLFAYQLAVVVDDIEQQVNHVVRGADILDSTPRQNFLYHCFDKPTPEYYHLPLVIDESGQKFSKSKLYPAINSSDASSYLVKALIHLGQKVESDLQSGTPQEILKYAVNNWSLGLVGKEAKLLSGSD